MNSAHLLTHYTFSEGKPNRHIAFDDKILAPFPERTTSAVPSPKNRVLFSHGTPVIQTGQGILSLLIEFLNKINLIYY
jgi:hypothetical protein